MIRFVDFFTGNSDIGGGRLRKAVRIRNGFSAFAVSANLAALPAQKPSPGRAVTAFDLRKTASSSNFNLNRHVRTYKRCQSGFQSLRLPSLSNASACAL
jgi:hypothetical protein